MFGEVELSVRELLLVVGVKVGYLGVLLAEVDPHLLHIVLPLQILNIKPLILDLTLAQSGRSLEVIVFIVGRGATKRPPNRALMSILRIMV